MVKKQLPPLNALKALDAFGRLGSLKAVADELNVHQTVVGRHIRNLEAWLGAQWINSGPSGVRLTAEGQVYFNRIKDAFDIIIEATHDMRPHNSRELRIWCAPGIAMMWLTPRLEEIRAAIPSVDIILRSAESFPDFHHYQADAAVYFSPPGDMGGQGEDIHVPRMVAVASPEFIKLHGPFEKPSDLLAMPLLHEDSRDRWAWWFAENSVTLPGPLSGMRLWYAHVATQAAVLGQGVALTNEVLAFDHIRAGMLVEIVPSPATLGAYRFIASRERWNEPTLVRLRSWLKTNLAATAATF